MKGRIARQSVEERPTMLPRVGRIKVGIKSPKGYPQSVDYFVASGKYADLFKQAYGEKPQTIQIVFPCDDPGEVCREEYEYRDDDGKLVARGDGQEFAVWNGRQYQTLMIDDYPNLMQGVTKRHPNRASRAGGDGWSVTLTLNFIVPLVRGVAGLWTFTSKGSASTIPQIRDAFDAMLAERGFCKGIIWDMSVQFATSQKPGDRSRYPVVTIVPNESAENIKKIKEAFEPIKQIER